MKLDIITNMTDYVENWLNYCCILILYWSILPWQGLPAPTKKHQVVPILQNNTQVSFNHEDDTIKNYAGMKVDLLWQ